MPKLLAQGDAGSGDHGSMGWDASPPRELGEGFALVPGHRVVPGVAPGRQESGRQLCQSCSPPGERTKSLDHTAETVTTRPRALGR